ncbi:MAG: dihydroneopterin aldolase [Endozoicomonadaceae bacterium]|nr:dihydroneopterin aldolase [Endozoicomonadaceae bacterium]
MDMVRIDNLYVETIIGFYHWEHEEPQPLHIDLELGTNFSDAFVSDDLSDVLDYAALSRRVKQCCQQSRFHLLEALCGRILTLIFTEFAVQSVRLEIRKPHALRNGIPSVECYRTREQMGICWRSEKESA